MTQDPSHVDAAPDAQAPASTQDAAKPSFVKRHPKKLIALALVTALIGGGAWYLFTPVELQDYTEAVSAESRDLNTALSTALVAAGVPDALTDVTAERVYIAYELPLEEADEETSEEAGEDAGDEETESDAFEGLRAVLPYEEFMQYFILGIAAGVAPDSERAVLVQYVDGEPVLSWTIRLEHFHAFMGGTMPPQEFVEKIVKREY